MKKFNRDAQNITPETLPELDSFIKRFNATENDSEKIKILLMSEDFLKLELDSDHTSFMFCGLNETLTWIIDNDNETIFSLDSFDDYIGYTDLLVDLLGAVGIESKPC